MSNETPIVPNADKIEIPRANPFMMALVYITLIGVVLGVILLFVGFSNPYMGTLPLAYIGIGLIGLAATALLVALGAAAARWTRD
ncbi:hypothetical protein O159_25070 [Leifsonia xyli subsp. cynodontis DSM 46306]|uniref:Integral membrane protein n=1 Tax=Leifsonia xyli subsp. cynodontis DSM 46306 TaxID=1389489 RepID=U3P9E6_LEIXC|nr:hypothetical protein [Leifsonia xyli]AGW42441.1 hypothetical protein O159_25070 [Leifsonia xyli subsp. cynodontis DSM 46306]